MFRKVLLVLVMMAAALSSTLHAQTLPSGSKPFIMPVAGESGASTWILGQPYGNTTGSFTNGASSYAAGQYLHFGIDISMRCGTPVIAVGDGVVHSVDNMSHGSAPHNAILSFPELGLAVLYGHLLERPTLIPGEPIRQGDVVGLSGSPDSNCESRPHLHLEVRSLDRLTAYNAINYIEAPWHSLVGLGVLSRSPFQMDLNNARRWMTMEDQPDVRFGGSRLNNYSLTYPAPFNRRAPANTLPKRPFTPIAETWHLRQLGLAGCCFGAGWHPSESHRLFVIDGGMGQAASVYEILTDGSGVLRAIQAAPPPFLSADGTHEIIYAGDKTIVRRLSDATEWQIFMSGRFPILSPDNRTLAWIENREVWVGSLESSETRSVWGSSTQGSDPDDAPSVRWLDGGRLLVTERNDDRLSTLHVLNIQDGSAYTLGTWYNLRSMNIAPGGERLIFFSLFNADPANDGAFLIETAPNATPQKLSWFADYRWRDAESVYYITFDSATDIQQLNFYQVMTGESRPLTNPETMPFTIANGDWSVSPDGNTIAFQDARDGNLWLLEPLNAVTTSPNES
jgi:murein DD-endopeptidase MepM/ murein hydrolase activator NlpD